MVSRKRCSYASEIETSTDSEDLIDDQEYTLGGPKSISRAGKRMKCSTKNALMARENRLKKKAYIQGLENEVKKLKHNNKTLQSILDNQSIDLTELRREIKYLKSVVANSSDLGNLLRTVNCNTEYGDTSVGRERRES